MMALSSGSGALKVCAFPAYIFLLFTLPDTDIIFVSGQMMHLLLQVSGIYAGIKARGTGSLRLKESYYQPFIPAIFTWDYNWDEGRNHGPASTSRQGPGSSSIRILPVMQSSRQAPFYSGSTFSRRIECKQLPEVRQENTYSLES